MFALEFFQGQNVHSEDQDISTAGGNKKAV